VALTVILGLLITLAAAFVSMALLVRTSFGRVPHAISFLPAPLVLYNLWMAVWFVFECLRQFAMTAMTPASALRLVAFVFLVAGLLATGFLYGCVSVVHQLLGGKVTRLVRRWAKHLALLYSGLLVVGWSTYHFDADTLLFSTARRVLTVAEFPLALGAWFWLWRGTRSVGDAVWRGHLERLSRRYVALFASMLVFAAVRDRLEAAGPALPLMIDVLFVLVYTLVTVLWVESVQEAASPAPSSDHQPMP
jgi:hypothetical protein